MTKRFKKGRERTGMQGLEMANRLLAEEFCSEEQRNEVLTGRQHYIVYVLVGMVQQREE